MPKQCYILFSFLLILLVYRHPVSAQQAPADELISTTQGLSQGMIHDMLQDKEGFIWIATKGGLNRYDGYSFKVFTNDPQDTTSISSNAVSNLLEDSKGRLWVGTYDGGVNVYNKKTGRFLRIGLLGSRIESPIYELPGGGILAYAHGGSAGIISLPDTGEPVIRLLHIPGNRTIDIMVKDERGFIWTSCSDNSIFIFNPSTSGFELLYDGHRFTSLIEKTGKLLSARFGLSYIYGTIPLRQTNINEVPWQIPSVVAVDSTGKQLLPVGHFKPGSWGCNLFDFSAVKAGDPIGKANGFSLNNATGHNTNCLLLDRSGVLWVGTMGYGIYKHRIRNNRFHPLLPGMSLQRITVLNDKNVYIQGWNGVASLTATGNAAITLPEKMFGQEAYSVVLQAKNGDYWVYRNHQVRKLFRYTADMKLAATYFEPVNPVPTEHLQPMIEDRKGHIWVCGTNGTLARVDPLTDNITKFVIDIEKYTGATALAQTNAFYEDGQGIFWMGTEHGLARLEFSDGASPSDIKWFKNIPGNSHSLSYNYVSWLMDDPAEPGYLWVCTKGGGLDHMEKSGGKFTHYTTKQGLPNDVVYGVLADNAGNIWGSTNKGLFCLLAEKKGEQPVIRVFSTSDGLQADEFNTNAFAKLPNGNLAFGGVNGVNIFNPQQVLSAGYTPLVFITSIQIGNKTVLPGDETGVLRETIEQATSITLHYQQDVLTLEFSSLDFTAPQQNKYRYKLTGIDKDWVESGTRRTATYLHLPSGTYTFKVQGSNSQGIWSNYIATLTIKVLPPWWRTWWAYAIYALLIALAIRTYLRFKINKAKLQSQLGYEQLEAQRVKELDTAKTQLYTNITHEFRTPLTVIMGMAQQVIEKPDEQFDIRMNMIVRNGRSLLNLVNQLLDLSKLENGKMHLQLSRGDIIRFLRYIVESFHSLAESQQKQLHFLTDINTLYMEYDGGKLQQIVSNLLSNAIKFTPEKGNIYISVTENIPLRAEDQPALIIKVKDTGIGIPRDQLQYVFDRFYRLDNSHTRKTEGAGIGLALVKELVKLMNGAITVKSPPPGAFKGTEFTVSLPLRKISGMEEHISEGFYERSASLETVQANSTVAEVAGNIDAPLILLVEDNADVVAYIASCLAGYRLAVGKDGREGLDIAIDMIPDLIITDVMMPFMDGFELVSKLRADEKTSHIPVIMLTAKADAGSKIEGLQQGADAYLEKPFNTEELLVRVKKMLEARKMLQQYYLKKAGVSEGMLPETMMLPDPFTAYSIEDGFVKRVREVVEQHLPDINFTVEKLCRLVFMSHSQLHRKLDALTGCSPNKFIRMIRLKQAKELLQDPANSIASVALDCGYNDPGYFARVFKQEYGVTPQEWRFGK